jgi:vacuolar iron transporter family protein
MEFKYLSFGLTSAVMTSMAVIMGFSTSSHAQGTIVTALLILAIADNISDSFGVHIQEESELKSREDVRKATFRNFIARLMLTLVFILYVLLLPMIFAVVLSVATGILILIFLSISISKQRKTRSASAIIQHLALAIAILAVSYYLRHFIDMII